MQLNDATNNVSIVTNFIDTLMSQLNVSSTNSNDKHHQEIIDTPPRLIETKSSHNIDKDTLEPQLRLDVLLAENKELLNKIDDENEYDPKKEYSHRKSTFAHNTRSNLSNYNYYKQYFNRLSSNAFNSEQFITQNPSKVHQIWSHTLRSKENNDYNYSTLTNNNINNEEGGIWDKLYCDAEIMRIKKNQLRQKYIQSENEKLQSLQNTIYNQRKDKKDNIDYHRIEYDDDTVWHKLYNDYFIRQKKLQKQQKIIESDWIQNNLMQLSTKNQNNIISQNHQYHFDENIPVENRLIQWNQYRQRKLQRKQSQMFQEQCTFKPELRIYNQSKSKSLKKECSSKPKVFNRLYSQYKQKQMKQQELYHKAQRETTFRPNINLSQRKVPAPSNTKRLYKYTLNHDDIHFC